MSLDMELPSLPAIPSIQTKPGTEIQQLLPLMVVNGHPATGDSLPLPSPQDGQTDDQTLSQVLANFQATRRRDKGKGVSAEHLAARDSRPSSTSTNSLSLSLSDGQEEDMLEWESYEPPEALTKLPNIESDIIRYVVESSIANIKARIEEERTLVREREEAERRAHAIKEDQQGKEVVTEEHTQSEAKMRQPSITIDTPDPANQSLSTLSHGTRQPLEIPIAPSQKRSRFGFRRLLRRDEKGVFRHKGSHSVNRIDLTIAAMIPLAMPHAKPADLLGMIRPSGGDTKQDVLVECVSCLDDVPEPITIKLTCHSYCHPCFIRLVTSAISNEIHWPPKCCLTPIPSAKVLQHIPAKLSRTYREKDIEWSIPAPERVYCSTASCSIFLKADQINSALHAARCDRGHWTCTMCRGPQHPRNEACPHDQARAQTEALATQEGWKHCTSCGVLVEHQDACQHMTCRCGAQFCYVCGLVWRTCRCSMAELRDLKRAASERRAARSKEASDIAEAIRQVEEFEREQARKAELLEAEKRRLEMEVRREERARKRQEELARRKLVLQKFAELGEMMEELNELQRVMVGYNHDRGVEKFEHHVQEERGNATRELAKKKEEARKAKEDRLQDVKEALHAQFEARLVEQKLLEAEYESRLRSFWEARCKKPEHVDDKVETCLSPWQAGNIMKMDQWVRWAEDEMAKKKTIAEETEAIQVEGAEVVAYRVEEESAKKEAEGVLRRKVDWKWFDVVVEARAVMLAEMEAGEVGAGQVEDDTDDEDEGEVEAEVEGEEGAVVVIS